MEGRLNEPGGATLVNVLGAGGAGTTMLALMLGNSTRGFTPGETRAWYRPSSPNHFTFGCWCRRNPCPLWERLGVFPEDEFFRRVSDELAPDVVADSSKWLDWARDAGEWAERDGYRVRNVLIWREPVDLVYTMWRRGRLGGGKRERPSGDALVRRGTAALARQFFDYTEKAFAGFGPTVVSCERLIDDPAGVLEALCDRIGITYRPGQERFWEKEHHTLFGNETARKTIEAGDGGGFERTERDPEFDLAATELVEAIESHERIQGTLRRLRAASL